jgi:hypothetical protein
VARELVVVDSARGDLERELDADILHAGTWFVVGRSERRHKHTNPGG